jgi:Flp pilus assembly protein TadB
LYQGAGRCTVGSVSSYGWKLGGAAIAILLLGVLALVIFDRIWFRVGFGAAIIVLFGGLLVLAWRLDRKDKAKRAGLDELPPI